MRDYSIDMDDCPTIFNRDGKQGGSSLIAGGNEIKLNLQCGLQMIDVRRATEDELKTCPGIELTFDML